MRLRTLGIFSLLLACMVGHTDPASQDPTPSGEMGWDALFDGQTLKGWKILKELDFDQAGKVEVQDGYRAERRGTVHRDHLGGRLPERKL